MSKSKQKTSKSMQELIDYMPGYEYLTPEEDDWHEDDDEEEEWNENEEED